MILERTWRGRVFIATSLDGFIARQDSDLAWLTDPAESEHSRVHSDTPVVDYEEFMADTDHLVMGRGTYDKVLTFGQWPYPRQQVFVLSTTMSHTDPRITVTASLEETATLLSTRRATNVYVDGGKVIQEFLRADLIDELTISQAPVLLGAGIPLYGTLQHDVRLQLRAANVNAAGMTQATYNVVR